MAVNTGRVVDKQKMVKLAHKWAHAHATNGGGAITNLVETWANGGVGMALIACKLMGGVGMASIACKLMGGVRCHVPMPLTGEEDATISFDHPG